MQTTLLLLLTAANVVTAGGALDVAPLVARFHSLSSEHPHARDVATALDRVFTTAQHAVANQKRVQEFLRPVFVDAGRLADAVEAGTHCVPQNALSDFHAALQPAVKAIKWFAGRGFLSNLLRFGHRLARWRKASPFHDVSQAITASMAGVGCPPLQPDAGGDVEADAAPTTSWAVDMLTSQVGPEAISGDGDAVHLLSSAMETSELIIQHELLVHNEQLMVGAVVPPTGPHTVIPNHVTRFLWATHCHGEEFVATATFLGAVKSVFQVNLHMPEDTFAITWLTGNEEAFVRAVDSNADGRVSVQEAKLGLGAADQGFVEQVNTLFSAGHQAPFVCRPLPVPAIGYGNTLANVTAYLVGSSSETVTVTGLPGSGVSVFLVRLAHALHAAGAFPSGVFVVDLPPVGDAEALATALCSAVGLSVPATVNATKALSLWAETRVHRGVVLVDVSDSRPVDPAITTMLASQHIGVVIGRHSTDERDTQAALAHLNGLQHADAVELVAALNPALTPNASAIAKAAGHLPAVISTMVRLPHTTLQGLLVAGNHTLSDALTAAWEGVRHRALGAFLRAMHVFGGTDFDVVAAAAVGNTTQDEAQALVDSLERRGLLKSHGGGKWAVPDDVATVVDPEAALGVQPPDVREMSYVDIVVDMWWGSAASPLTAQATARFVRYVVRDILARLEGLYHLSANPIAALTELDANMGHVKALTTLASRQMADPLADHEVLSALATMADLSTELLKARLPPATCLSVWQGVQRAVSYAGGNLAHSYINVAKSHYAQREFHSMLASAKDALELYIARGDVEGAAVARHNMGIAHRWLQQPDAAVGLLRHAGKGYEDANMAANDTDAIVVMSDLASALHEWGGVHQAEALQLRREALQLAEAKLGGRHPYVATMYGNLASAEYELGNFSTAEELYRKALDIEVDTLTHFHPDVASTHQNLANTLVNLDRPWEAQELFKAALSVASNLLHDDHPSTASIRSDYGVLLLQLAAFSEAKQHLLAALPVLESSLHSTNRLAIVRTSLGLVEQAVGNHTAAVVYFRAAMTVNTTDSAIRYDAWSGLAATYAALNSTGAALHASLRAASFGGAVAAAHEGVARAAFAHSRYAANTTEAVEVLVTAANATLRLLPLIHFRPDPSLKTILSRMRQVGGVPSSQLIDAHHTLVEVGGQVLGSGQRAARAYVELYTSLARLHLAAFDVPAANQSLTEARSHADSLEAITGEAGRVLGLMATVAAARGRFVDAELWLQRAVAASRTWRHIWEHRHRLAAVMALCGKLKAAAVKLQHHPPPHTNGKHYVFTRASVWLLMGRFQDAAIGFESEGAFVKAGDCWAQAGDHSRALLAYERAGGSAHSVQPRELACRLAAAKEGLGDAMPPAEALPLYEAAAGALRQHRVVDSPTRLLAKVWAAKALTNSLPLADGTPAVDAVATAEPGPVCNQPAPQAAELKAMLVYVTTPPP